MTIFNKTADMLRKWSAPSWLKIMIRQIWDIIWVILASVGRDYIQRLEIEIVKIGQNNTLTNRQKFDKVFQYARTIGITITDSALNLLIEMLISRLKKKAEI